MKPVDQPFVALESVAPTTDFKALERRPAATPTLASHAAAQPAVGTLEGFDLLEQALVGHLAALPGQVIASRSALALKRSMVGRQVLLMFEAGDLARPIIVGVLEPHPLMTPTEPPQPVAVEADGERHLIQAEREIVLRCGDASITLTRAGKVIIKGHYILSRSTGYNKIKGAAIDIN